MSHWIDDLSQGLAEQRISRRAALGKAAVAFGGAMLAGVQPARGFEVRPICVRPHRRCGSACCGPHEQCHPRGARGGFCCRRGHPACPDRKHCCAPDHKCCGETCCGPHEFCLTHEHSICCKRGEKPCGEECCGKHQTCCVPTGTIGGEQCCRGNDVCTSDGCCPPKNACRLGNQLVCCGGGGFMCCNGKCVDTKTDANNCGGCGRTCPPGQTCVQGMCLDECDNVTCTPEHPICCNKGIPGGGACCDPGDLCCPPGSASSDGACCPGAGFYCCNGTCCGQGAACCRFECCDPPGFGFNTVCGADGFCHHA